MGKSLTFSVGISTFYQVEDLEATIESLLNQTRSPGETLLSEVKLLARLIVHKPYAGYSRCVAWIHTART